ncbi:MULTISPECIES: hypothetical protein [Enterobacter]|uniref:hypothetical protein n=1 Tax=Enterobacter TaxID=547 RepID=UPI00064CF561|nr:MULTISPECIES: hypothetical protein [Enterobacter]PAN91565.1 hypothetical protein CIW64_09230 [Enterobacter cloacae]KLW88203.1 hypothetical protein SP99_03546 [Enterobacter sp. BIDMC92]MBO2912422.1 hypothetical protein [Enterobacter sichuanensis]MBO2932723.1 hypothetical protein [Enterobacter sichuanensis]MCM7886174.1 hypothetical protein [Enterobacter sichuanensis]
MKKYKIAYEHSSNGEKQNDETLMDSDHEPTREELEHAFSRDTLRFHHQGLSTRMIISVVTVK